MGRKLPNLGRSRVENGIMLGISKEMQNIRYGFSTGNHLESKRLNACHFLPGGR